MKVSILSTFLLGLIIFLAACGDQGNQDSKYSKRQLAEGFELINTYCVSCHSPAGKKENRAAPPLIAVKRHYQTEESTFTTFTESIRVFLKHPSKENSKMPDALQRFGLMPQINLKDDDVAKIAAYLYYTEFESPEWFIKHYNKNNIHTNSSTHKLSIAEGEKWALQTKAVLGKNLLAAIQSQGSAGAVAFCNERALPLTDSISHILNASIRRISDSPRNPENQAQPPFIKIILDYKTKLANGTELQGGSLTHEGQQYFYYPIVTNEMCLQCHGKKAVDIIPQTLSIIQQLYPNDKATGYTVNQLRGLWVVKEN